MKSKITFPLFFIIVFIDFFSCNQSKSKENNMDLAVLGVRLLRSVTQTLQLDGGTGFGSGTGTGSNSGTGTGSSGGSGSGTGQNTQDIVSLSGTVKGPGSIQNAKVHTFQTPSNGKCVNDNGTLNGTAIATATSDANGKYTLSYPRTGSSMCVVVIPGDGSQIEVFQPATKTNVPRAWSGTNSLMAIINEPPSGTATRTANVTPFTRMAARRFSALSNLNGSSRVKSKVFYKINKTAEGYLGGKNSRKMGISGNRRVEFRANTPATLLERANEEIENSFFPKRDKTTFSLETVSPDEPSVALKLGSIAILADKRGGGTANGSSTAEDFEKVINFMEEDFSDGKFDGKKIDPVTNTSATLSADDLGGVVATTTAADNFLTSTFKDAVTEYDTYDDEYASTADDIFFCDPDSNTDGCDFAIIPGSPPEIWIFGPDGEFIDLNGFYDYGRVGVNGSVGGTGKTGEYTIVNTGGTDLVLTGAVTFADPQFTVVSQPSLTIGSGAETVFQVRFEADSVASFSTAVSIESNDTFYSPYDFTLSGDGEDLDTDLQLYWAFNGSANDSTANANHGNTAGGASLTMDIFGNANSAFNFTGTSWIDATAVDMSTVNVGSFSAWVSPSDLSGIHIILDQGASADFSLSFPNNTSLKVTAVGEVVSVTIDELDFLDTWNLITGVYNDAGDLVLYVNGVEVGRTTITSTFNFPSIGGQTFNVGKADAGSDFFIGDIDDVRLYSRALTPEQIQALYNQEH